MLLAAAIDDTPLDCAGPQMVLPHDPHLVLRPAQQIGHGQPGRAGEVTGQGELGDRLRQGLSHGLPPPA